MASGSGKPVSHDRPASHRLSPMIPPWTKSRRQRARLSTGAAAGPGPAFWIECLPLACVVMMCLTLADRAMAAEPMPPRRVYSRLLEPAEHPDYDRRAVKPPTGTTFKNRTQFTCLRGFRVEDGKAVGFAEDLE